MEHNFTTYTYPNDYGSEGFAGKKYKALYPPERGLVIIPEVLYSLRRGVFTTRKWALVHIATGRNFSGPHGSIEKCLRIATAASALLDFGSFTTVSEWTRILKADKEVTAKLKAIAERGGSVANKDKKKEKRKPKQAKPKPAATPAQAATE